MAYNPISQIFPFDYICEPTLKDLEDNIKNILIQTKGKIDKFVKQIKGNDFYTFTNTLLKQRAESYDEVPLYFSQGEIGKKKPKQIDPEMIEVVEQYLKNGEIERLGEIKISYDLMSAYFESGIIEYTLNQIKKNCIEVMKKKNIEKEIMCIKQIVEEMKSFSINLLSIKHLLYLSESEYFGHVTENNSKEGFGCLKFKDPPLLYEGFFINDIFTRGIIFDEKAQVIYKGNYQKEGDIFDGLKVKYNNDLSIDYFFFGTIDLAKDVYNGCFIRYSQSEVEGQGQQDKLKVSYYNNNFISLKLDYENENDIKITSSIPGSESILQYYSGKYLIESSKKFTRAICLKKKNGFYSGGLKKKSMKENGEGVTLYSNGDYFVGSYLEGKREGKGHYYNWDEKIFYEGEFKNDRATKVEIKEDIIKKVLFEGEVDEEEIIIKGKIFYNNGEVYEGEFKNGTRNGNGKYTYINKDDKKENDIKEITVSCKWEKGVRVGEGKVESLKN